MKFGTFGPFEIGGVGDKHPHDSDHVKCMVQYVYWDVYVLCVLAVSSSSVGKHHELVSVSCRLSVHVADH